jgi:hypothetical protein
MEFYFRPLWVKVGHASMGGGSLCILERAGWYFSKCSSVEGSPVLLNVVYLEREIIVILKTMREWWWN